jgi:RNA polymerase sigma-54 factor
MYNQFVGWKSLKFDFDFSLVNSPKVLFTPQLKQVLNILRMNSQELYEYVEEELESNPVLEISEDSFFSDEELAIPEEQVQWDDSRHNKALREIECEEQYREDEPADIIHSVRISLKEYLLLQLQSSEIKKNQFPIAEYLIDNVDENGYLKSRLSDAAAFFNIPLQEVERVLAAMQAFDPPGILARDLKECLLIQIGQLKNIDQDVVVLIEKYLDDLAAGKLSEVSRTSGLNEQKLSDLFDFIKTLEPKPGREFYNTNDIKYVVPDIIIKKINGKFEVFLNEGAIPAMSISSYYRRMLKQDIGDEPKRFIQDKITNAKRLIKCMELRRKAVKMVAEFIVRKEENFLEKGKQHMELLNIKSAAKELASRGINVNAVAPGFIETDMTSVLNDKLKEGMLNAIPLKKFGKALDVANLVAFLASDESSYITGQVISVDGGLAF